VFSSEIIFSRHDTSYIADRIGLPIFTRCRPSSPRWLRDQNNEIFGNESPFKNQAAAFLHLCCDPKAAFDLHTGTAGWDWASQQWQKEVGSAIAVRPDQKPLSTLYVEALYKYCHDETCPKELCTRGDDEQGWCSGNDMPANFRHLLV